MYLMCQKAKNITVLNEIKLNYIYYDVFLSFLCGMQAEIWVILKFN